MSKKHIFIAYTNTGMGHKIPAYAIADAIEELYPNEYHIICSNFFEDAGEGSFNRYIEKAWDIMLKYPLLTKFVVWLGQCFPSLSRYYMCLFHPRMLRSSIAYLKDTNPDIVLATHWFPQTVALDVRKRFPKEAKFPVIALNPDTFETFPFWDTRGDLFLVCSQQAKDMALRWHHRESAVKMVSPALRKEFDAVNFNVDKQALRQELNIRPDVFTVLMSDGGQGVGKMSSYIKQLIKIDRPINIIAICAKNEKLYTELSELKQKLEIQNPLIQLTLFKFVDKVQPLIAASDIFIGKSGPSTILECLKMQLPVLVNFSASTAERTIVKFFRKENVLWTINKHRVNKTLIRMMDQPSILQDTQDILKNLSSIQNGTYEIANILVDVLEKNSV